MKNVASKCVTCLEDGKDAKAVGYIDGEAYCQTHLASLDGVAKHYGLKIADEEGAPLPIKPVDPVKALPLALPASPSDPNGVVDLLGHVMRGVLDGSYTARQANAVCALSQTALKAVELDWKMKRSKDISYIVKQLDGK